MGCNCTIIIFRQLLLLQFILQEMTKKSVVHKFLFGNHYRKYYSLPIEAKTATLDTLMGGLKPIREGGGHQSVSLRMSDPKGREYVMRAMKKSATQFLQSVAFKDQYIVNDFEDTYAENFLLDFYTTSHPYTPFAVGSMADQIGLTAYQSCFVLYSKTKCA